MKKYIIWLTLLLSLIPHSIFAYTAMSSEWQLRIENSILDNLYTAGGKINILGNVNGDLALAGGEIIIDGKIRDNAMIAGGDIKMNGIIENDLLVVGGNVKINSPVFGDIRAAGGSITLENSSSWDVMLGGWEIRIAKWVIIHKDLAIAGGSVNMDGTVKWKADIIAWTLELHGIIEKDVSLRINEITNLYIGSGAKIMGKLTYRAPERIPALENIAVGWSTYAGVTEFSDMENEQQEMSYWFFSGYLIYRLLFLLIIGWILFHSFHNFIRKTTEIVRNNPGKSFLNGFLYFVLMPIIFIICFITVIGIPIGFLLIALYVFSFVFAKVITLVILSELIIQKWQNKISEPLQKWGIFVLLAIILTLVSGIDFIATVFAFGAIITKIGNSYSKSIQE
jgi:hypothetical protein